MPKYTLTVDTDADPDVESGLQKVTGDFNAALPENAAPLTVQKYLERTVAIAVQSYAQQAVQSKIIDLGEKFKRADDTARTTVEDTLAQFSPKTKTVKTR